jgi:putative membrane protein
MVNKQIFSEAELQKLSKVITQAESKTSGEIVPVIVQSSSAVGHVPWVILGFFMGLVFVMERTWLAWSWYLLPTWVYLVLFIVGLGLSQFLAQFHWFQRVLTPNEDEEMQVLRRAELEFFEGSTQKTKHQTGILIFVSLMEHRAVVLADQGISQHYSQETWDEVVQILSSEFKKGRYYEGLEMAILRCGQILEEKLPACDKNPNEVSNRVILK